MQLLDITNNILNNFILNNLCPQVCSYITHNIHFIYDKKTHGVVISNDTINNIINKNVLTKRSKYMYRCTDCKTTLYIKYGKTIDIGYHQHDTRITHIQSDYLIGLAQGIKHFKHCTILRCIPKNINVQKVYNMSSMFNGATLFNCDLNRWDTKHVTDMSYMFYMSPVFNGNICTFDTSNVKNMRHMFWGSYAFNQNISGWNTKNVMNKRNIY